MAVHAEPKAKPTRAAAEGRVPASGRRNDHVVQEVARAVLKLSALKLPLPKSPNILHKTRRRCNQCGAPLYLARVQSLRTFFVPRFELLCVAEDCRYHRVVRVISDA